MLDMSTYYPLRKTIKKLNLHPNTLRRYADEKKIKSIRNVGGQRLYDVDDFLQSKGYCHTVCYCRVSSPKQRDDLLRQIEKLKQIYPKAEIIQDIGSGLNFKRKGMYSLLERLMQGDKLQVVVSHRDRLARFGYDIFKFLVERNGGEIVVLDNYVSTSREAELTADLMAILHHASCRMHGARSHSNKKDTNLSYKRTS
jgi:predicted site-specific integrase-resolvase